MRREFWLSSLFGVLLGLCMALGAVGCLATAFELTVLDPQKLLLICLAGLCLCALMCRWRWGDLVLLVAVGAALGYLLRREEFLTQLRQLIFRISYIYDLAYGWGAVSWPGMTWDAGAADLPLLVLALLLGMSVCRSVCRGKPVMVPLMLALLPLAACLVVTDTVPGWQSLCLLLFAGVMLLLTGSVREDSPEQANRLTMMGVIPVAAALAVLFLAAPQDGYVNKTEDIRQSLRDWLQPLSQELEAGTGEGRLELTTPQPEETVKRDRLKVAWNDAMKAAEASGPILPSVWKNTKDGLRMVSTILPTIMSIGLLGMLIALFTPVFNVIGYIFYPFAAAIQVPEALLTAQAVATSIAEMFLPAAFVVSAPLATRYVVSVVCISELLFFSAVIPCILSTKIPVTIPQILILWVERVILSILLAGAVALVVF